jgi:hypothetical protein
MKASHLGEAECWCGLILRRSSKFAVLPNVPADQAYMAYASLPLNAMPRKWFLILAYGYAVMSLYLLA